MKSVLLTLSAVLPLFSQDVPPAYVCGRATTPPLIDGSGDDSIWQEAHELSPLRDIEGSAIPHACRIRMLWDDHYLYILADMDEEHLRAAQKKHDSIIFHDPDFEVFIDPDGDGLNYIELEINALNTTWDLFITRPYRFNDPHILHDWEIPGLKHAVNLRGTLNNSTDTDEGWSVELAIPWSSITTHDHQPRTGKAPAPGTEMRFNFSRVNWQVTPTPDGGYHKLPYPESNHVWAPTGKVNIHLPEHWGRVIFSSQPAGKWVASPPAPHETTRLALYKVLNDQLEHRGKHGAFSKNPALPPLVQISYPLPDFFILTATCPHSGIRMSLDSEGRYTQTSATRKKPHLYLWVHGNTNRSSEEWFERFHRCADAGISTVIIDGSSERIKELTTIAKAAGLRVFAWLWVLNRPQDSAALQHPGWYAVNAQGKSCHKREERPFVDYYQFLCPNNEEVKQHLLEQVRKLASIPGLSGIQADYMRLPDVELPRALWDKYNLDMSRILPEYDYCYCPTCLQKFGKTPQQNQEWKNFRLQSVAALYNTLATEIRRHGLLAACAVFPTPDTAARMVYQDWGLFHADLVLPMVYHSFYNEPASWAISTTEQASAECEGRIPMAPGVHLPDMKAADLPNHLNALSETGVHGIGIFSDDELSPEHLQSIRQWSRGEDE